jgi:hypothetical protein
MRHPPSPLLLSARKRRPRRNPPRGAQLGSPTPGEQRAEAEMHEQQQQAQASTPDEQCALLTPGPGQTQGDERRHGTQDEAHATPHSEHGARDEQDRNRSR